MTVGMMHRLSLSATVCLPVLGLISGSDFLFYICLLYMGIIPVGYAGLHSHHRRLLRTLLVHGGTLGALLIAVLNFSRSPIDSGLLIVMAGILNRYLLRLGQRDDLILVGASGVLLAAATIITPGFSFALILLLFVPASLWAMLSASILGLAERREYTSSRSNLFKALSSRPAPGLSGVLTGWGLALMIAGYTAVSFLPRYKFAHFLSAGGLMAFSGSGTHMELTSGGVNSLDPGQMILRLYGFKPTDSVDGLYARLYALDVFDGKGFSDGQGKIRPFFEAQGHAENCHIHAALQRQVPRSHPHPVATLGRTGPTQVLVPNLRRFQSGTMVTNIPLSALDMRYRVCVGFLAPSPLFRVDRLQEAYIARFLDLPQDLDPRLKSLSARLVSGAQSTEDKVQKLLRYFSEAFKYQLSPMEGLEEDPLIRFLFEAKAGHCELFAGALAVLLRLEGIPARVASGFYGGRFNRRNRQLEFSSSDAHAWVEVLIDGQWRWIDATPETGRTRRQDGQIAWLGDIWNALEGWWFEYVIDFDEQRRQALVSELKSYFVTPWFQTFESWRQGSSSATPSSRAHRGSGSGVYVGLGGLGLALGLLGWGWSRRRSEVYRLGRRLRMNLGSQYDGIPLSIAARAQPEPLNVLACRAVGLYEAYRYGPDLTKPELSTLREAVLQFVQLASKRGAHPSGGILRRYFRRVLRGGTCI